VVLNPFFNKTQIFRKKAWKSIEKSGNIISRFDTTGQIIFNVPKTQCSKYRTGQRDGLAMKQHLKLIQFGLIAWLVA